MGPSMGYDSERARGLRGAIEKELTCPIEWANIIPNQDGGGLIGDMENMWEHMVESSDLPSCELIDPIFLAVKNEFRFG